MPIGNSGALHTIAYVLLSVLCAYGAGRVHQWYMHSMDRDKAFRDGYNHGYHALFRLAARRGRAAGDRHGYDERRSMR
ncbi:hypothetical protein OWR29_27505 [Actinoplanes sp. Pm04-4]|uniref:Uncharacterized protein n=1 Tax=Paractinoplanes pyxinae TaxID=2997416 RepID=A0ABT4B5J1_9ACTN|nr:hypothetical protein [Actinoplanes pyxinae]MCY1141761.1 hypothetical protein [Actinoplanes pyxinae]